MLSLFFVVVGCDIIVVERNGKRGLDSPDQSVREADDALARDVLGAGVNDFCSNIRKEAKGNDNG